MPGEGGVLGGVNAPVIRQVAELLARTHRAGLVHGDPLLRNFLWRPLSSGDRLAEGGAAGFTDELLAIDLGGVGPASREARRIDLIRFLGSVLFHTDDMDRAGRALHHYASLGEALPASARDLLQQAVVYGQRK